MPKVTGTENHRISLEAASALTRRFRRGTMHSVNGGVVGHYLGREMLDEILAQQGCLGVRMYHAEKESGEPTVVVVGVDEEGNDLHKGVIAEFTWPCPPLCSAANPLAS